MSENNLLSLAGDHPQEPLEQLEERICELAAHLAAGTCRFLQLIAEFDTRRGWASWDLPSCAAWLAWKCQVASGTAREHVRVARALTTLPVITREFAAGRMSYAKTRALTRIATPATETELAQITGPMTAAQCERFAAAYRTASDDDELANQATRRVSIHVAEDGSVSVTARLPAADGAVVLQALRAAAGDCEHPDHPATGPADDAQHLAGVSAGTPADMTAPEPGDDTGQRRTTCAASLADALVQVAGAYLSGKIATASNPDIYQVIVHVGPEALTPATPARVPAETPADQPRTSRHPVPAQTPADQPGTSQQPVSAETRADDSRACLHPGCATASPLGRPAGHPAHPARCHLDDGPALSPAAAQAIACHATVSWMLHDHQGNVLDVGRRHRRATPALRRAVRERDRGRCQFPGCNSRRTDIHHVVPWAKGGKTRLRDLILVCEAHHVIIHALGYLITSHDGTFTFTRPNGQPLPRNPGLPGSDGHDLARCHDADITTETIIPDGLADKLDLDLAIWAAFANTRLDREATQHDHDLAA